MAYKTKQEIKSQGLSCVWEEQTKINAAKLKCKKDKKFKILKSDSVNFVFEISLG